jgi:hypothetical protein
MVPGARHGVVTDRNALTVRWRCGVKVLLPLAIARQLDPVSKLSRVVMRTYLSKAQLRPGLCTEVGKKTGEDSKVRDTVPAMHGPTRRWGQKAVSK